MRFADGKARRKRCRNLIVSVGDCDIFVDITVVHNVRTVARDKNTDSILIDDLAAEAHLLQELSHHRCGKVKDTGKLLTLLNRDHTLCRL